MLMTVLRGDLAIRQSIAHKRNNGDGGCCHAALDGRLTRNDAWE